MMYVNLSYASVCTDLACSQNWITAYEKAKPNHSYFRTLIGDTVRGLQKGETVYVFTQEQLALVLHRCNQKAMRVAFKKLEDCFRIENIV
jgi:hypothetical protein